MVNLAKPLILLACTLLSLPVAGQQDSLTQSEDYYRQGMEIFDYQHRKEASEKFILAAQYNPKNAKAFFMAGQSILFSLRKEHSLPYYKKAYSLNPNVDQDILYLLGQAYHYSEQFDSAILFYNRYTRLVVRTMNYAKTKKINEVNRKVFECYNAKVMRVQPVNVTITHLGGNINSAYPDYAPSINADGTYMIFTSRRPEGNINARVAKDHGYYEDIFYSTKENGDWTPAQNMTGPIKTDFHNASINLSPDGKEMLVYRDTDGGDVYATVLQSDGTWTKPETLVGINTPYIENSATISADGNTIYFTSNRPGGYGGTDIYRCTKDSKGRWMNPQNLGELINTEMDEDGVFISANARHLYFSSNGHSGMGGLDIYRSAYNEEKQQWEKPINMGYPINSVENDIYFVSTGDEGIAYFSSVRNESLGEEDIYKLDISKWEAAAFTKPGYEESVMHETSPVMLSSNPKAEVASALKFTIYIAEGSSQKPMAAEVSLTASNREVLTFKEIGPGTYETEIKKITNKVSRFKLKVSHGGYNTYSSSYYFSGGNVNDPAISDSVFLDKVSAGTHSRITNAYFKHNSDVPKTYDEIDYVEEIMKASSTANVEISGHSDNAGPADYNMELSRRRAEAVKKYLVETGIEPTRISTTGYGSERPMADNKKRKGRQLNRRTELTILEK